MKLHLKSSYLTRSRKKHPTHRVFVQMEGQRDPEGCWRLSAADATGVVIYRCAGSGRGQL